MDDDEDSKINEQPRTVNKIKKTPPPSTWSGWGDILQEISVPWSYADEKQFVDGSENFDYSKTADGISNMISHTDINIKALKTRYEE